MSEPVTFVHLTDLHVSHPDAGDTRLLVDTVAVLDRAIARIKAMVPQPSFVIVSGDLTNIGDEMSYALVNDRLKALDLPVFVALGNHDKREAFAKTVLGRNDDLSAPYFYEHYDPALADAHIITLDTLIPGKVGGTLGDDQFAFLADALARHPDVQKIIVMHHPPALDEKPQLGWESIDFAATEKLAGTLAGHRVAAILSGHIHLNRVCHWNGIPIVIPTGQHNTVDPLYTKGLRLLESAGFALCTLRPSGLTATMVDLSPDENELRVIPITTLAKFS